MKQVQTVLSIILLAVILCNARWKAQELPPTEFPIGTFLSMDVRTVDTVYSLASECGFNTIVQYADESTKGYLENFNVIANNIDNAQDRIQFYATSFYSKWEAEENAAFARIGVKHLGGQQTQWHDTLCWSTLGINAPACSLVYGPHYRQENKYKRMDASSINYIPRFRMALYPLPSDPDQEICKIKVVCRYTLTQNGNNTTVDMLIRERTLKTSDFPGNGYFSDFYLSNNQLERTYQYPDLFESAEKLNIPQGDVVYTDNDGDNGIQFWVEWLREDTLCTLYIDYIEVYDNLGWNYFINSSQIVVEQIQDYLDEYSDWSNIINWYSHDEPYTVDAYEPMRIVDSLVRDMGGKPLITEFYPTWRFTINGEPDLPLYYQRVQPEKLMIDYYPVSAFWDELRWEDLQSAADLFQIAHSLQPGFWYVGQSYGIRESASPNNWCMWRQPENNEFNAMAMLALAHGVKGLLFWNFDAYASNRCGVPGYYVSLVGDSSNYTLSGLYNLLKDDIIPRLKGKLGQKLLGLNYSGDHLVFRYFNQTDNSVDALDHEYLCLSPHGTQNKYWHAGFFHRPNHVEDNYFFLINLLIPDSRTVDATLTPPVEGYINYSFRDVEGSFDTTFQTTNTQSFTYESGEGKLYQVSPVIKYGGRLIYDETTTDGMSLNDDMIIENGAILRISGTYNASGDIIIKNGSILYELDSKINFLAGKKLIRQ